MDHVAIMHKGLGLIERIVDGRKTIETRWYKTKRAPWGAISTGDDVYFKESGGSVVAKATVSKVLQIDDLNAKTAGDIIEKYGNGICFVEQDQKKLLEWILTRKYAVLIFLEKAKRIAPFEIDKTGYGNAAAWLCVGTISSVRVYT